uniref:hypothetical protein n=1 Tax=Candidatus Electrothrix sp. TaxID=2170559 RepID=UPI0040563D91
SIGGLPLDEEMKLYIWDYDGAGVEEWYEDAADFAGAKLIAVPSTGITVSFCSLQVNMVPIYKLLLL